MTCLVRGDAMQDQGQIVKVIEFSGLQKVGGAAGAIL
jgi:hypothetical protein